jgi:hypothetical protein
LLICICLILKRKYLTYICLYKVLLSNKRRKKGCYYKAICKRFIIKYQIRVNITDYISLILNALKSNAKLNAKLNACMQA